LFPYEFVKKIEHIYRMRLLYALHLTLYGTLMVLGVLTVDPVSWQKAGLVMMLWLPLLLAHTTAQTVLELRQRYAPNQPVPLPAFNRYTLPVILYDEQGHPIGSTDDQRMNYLPR
jgi:hypothetical protein